MSFPSIFFSDIRKKILDNKIQWNILLVKCMGVSVFLPFVRREDLASWFIIVGCFIFVCVVFWIESYVRKNKGTALHGDGKQRAAFIRWHLILMVTLLMHSLLLTTPPNFDAESEKSDYGLWVINLLKLDKQVVINSIHAVFVIGTSFRSDIKISL